MVCSRQDMPTDDHLRPHKMQFQVTPEVIEMGIKGYGGTSSLPQQALPDADRGGVASATRLSLDLSFITSLVRSFGGHAPRPGLGFLARDAR